MGNQIVEPTLDHLYVKTLGQFSVIKEGRSLEETAWVREKARILFQYFIINRRQFTSRERITYELWPNLDPERANRDFKVSLSAINKALQGSRQDKKNIGYIHRQGLSYRLNPSTSITVDADIFETKLKEGRRIEKNNPKSSIDLYRAGLEVYGGEFLPDRLYDDWASGEHERLTSIFLLGSTSFASLF
jgi:DNA-binding SARP family transcriptional activator